MRRFTQVNCCRSLGVLGTLLLLLMSGVSFGQTFSQVTHISGTQSISGVDVTVTTSGVSQFTFCAGDADPYYSGAGGSTITFTFSQPVASVKIPSQFGGGNVREFVYYVNGTFYPITPANVIGTSTSGCNWGLASVVGGKLQNTAGGQLSGVVKIDGSITSVTVQMDGLGADWMGMFFQMPPLFFVNGTTQSLQACKNSSAISINSLLKAQDDNSTNLTWTFVTMPAHGSISGIPVTNAAVSNTPIAPSATYTPNSGYTGPDAFVVQVSDGTNTATTTINVNVNPLPGTINSSAPLCLGQPATLSNIAPGGTWSSSNTSVLQVGSTDGVVSALAVGTSTIVYTAACGTATWTATVNDQPASISGNSNVCEGATTPYTDGSAFGAWSSTDASVASVGSGTGIVSGISSGTALISYTLFTGCAVSQMVTVDPLPLFSGVAAVCEGLTTTLSSSVSGGTWSSSDNSIATVSGSGTVTGILAGNVNVMYTTPASCVNSLPVTVNPLPATINGASNVCEGFTTSLSDATAGGTWSIDNSAVATISGSGDVTGVAAGTATVTYTLSTGCMMTHVITVDQSPASIFIPSAVCEGAAVGVTDLTMGGTWSVNNSMASIDGSGLLTGISAGNPTVSYTIANGCYATATATVNMTPAAITGANFMCYGNMTTLTDLTSGGSWSSSDPSVATVSGGMVTSVAVGTSTISYTLANSCFATVVASVIPLPNVSAGSDVTICFNSSTPLLATGADVYTWVPSDGLSCTTCDNPVASPTVTTTYTVTGTGAPATLVYNQAFQGGVIPTTQCIAWDAYRATLLGSYNYTGFTIRGSQNSTGISCTDPVVAAAVANALRSGTAYTGSSDGQTWYVGVGCDVGTPSCGTVSVELANQGLCSCSPGYSIRPQIGNSNWGGVGGNTCGAIDQTIEVDFYIMSTGTCSNTAVVTVSVNPLPAPVTGNMAICEAGGTVSLLDATPGGTWSSSNTAQATIDGTGMVTGVTAGTPDITYTDATTGCYVTAPVTVNPLPASITGSSNACLGLVTSLNDVSTGGTWSSSDITVATVGLSSGDVTGIALGTTSITYTLPTGCFISRIETVNPLPSAITGPSVVCPAQTMTLSDADGGGSWYSGNSALATVNASTGVVTGVASGSLSVTYVLPTGCPISASIDVLPVPVVYTVTGSGSYCSGGTGKVVDLSGSDAGFDYQLYYGTSMIGTAVSGTGSTITFGPQTGAGVYTAVATNTTTGCTSNMASSANITIDPLPVQYSVTGGGDFCDMGAGVHVGLANSDIGIDYQLYDGSLTMGGAMSGTSSALDFGLETKAGIYKVIATNTATGCMNTMSDSAIVIVNPLLVPGVSISTSLFDSVCAGSTDTFRANVVNGGSMPFYTWRVNGSVVGTNSPMFAYIPDQGDVVVVEMTSNANCLVSMHTATDEITVNLEDIYIPAVTIIADPGSMINKGQTVTFTAQADKAGPAPRYQWMRNKLDIPGATNATFTTNTISNKDSISCVVWGSGKCGLPSFNGLLMQVGTTGFNELSAGNIKVLPNPNKGTFTVKGSVGTANEEVSLEITNMLGQSVYTGKVTASEGQIDTQVQLGSNIANGMYMMNVRTTSGNTVFHIVVEQ